MRYEDSLDQTAWSTWESHEPRGTLVGRVLTDGELASPPQVNRGHIPRPVACSHVLEATQASLAIPTRTPWGSYSPPWSRSRSRRRAAAEPQGMLALGILEETDSEQADPGLGTKGSGTASLWSSPSLGSLASEKQELEEPVDVPKDSCPLEADDSPLGTPFLPPSSCPLTQSQMRAEFQEGGASCSPAPGSLWMELCARDETRAFTHLIKRGREAGGEVG